MMGVFKHKPEKVMLGPVQTEWVVALESGKYKQARGILENDRGCFCCLGVGCLVAEGLGLADLDRQKGIFSTSPQLNGVTLLHQTEVEVALNLRNHHGVCDLVLEPKVRCFLMDQFGVQNIKNVSLAGLNDSGLSHYQIAQVLRRFPSAYFKGPK